MATKTDDPTFDAANGVKISKQNRPFEPSTTTPLPGETVAVDDSVPPFQGEVGSEDDDVRNGADSEDFIDGLGGDNATGGGNGYDRHLSSGAPDFRF